MNTLNASKMGTHVHLRLLEAPAFACVSHITIRKEQKSAIITLCAPLSLPSLLLQRSAAG